MNPLEDEEDAWPDEPDEFDPDSIGPDPPTVEEPTVGPASPDDVPEYVAHNFVGAVIMANVALLALSVGAMFVYFRGNWQTGGATILVGLVAAFFVGRFYWRFRTHREDERDEGGGREPTGGDGP